MYEVLWRFEHFSVFFFSPPSPPLLRPVEKIKMSKRSRKTFSHVLRDRSNGNLKLVVVRGVFLDYPEDEQNKLLRNVGN